MRYVTYKEIRQKVERDLDLQDELFISPEEMIGYANEAIAEAEAEIIGTVPDYLLTSSSLPLIAGQSEYALPEDIYANKIRGVIYNSGSTVFPIKRVRSWNQFERIALQNQSQSEGEYQYILKNPSAVQGVKLVLIPAARETAGNVVTLWYLRSVARVESDDSVIDLPECAAFVTQFIKVRAYEKEGHPNLQMAISVLEHQRVLMQETLADMVPDQDTAIEMDLDAYEEMS